MPAGYGDNSIRILISVRWPCNIRNDLFGGLGLFRRYVLFKWDGIFRPFLWVTNLFRDTFRTCNRA